MQLPLNRPDGGGRAVGLEAWDETLTADKQYCSLEDFIRGEVEAAGI